MIVVDDSALNRRAIRRHLLALGVEVREADTLATGRSLDVTGAVCAILDLDLGDGSGVDLVRVFRQKVRDFPIAFFSASASSELVAQARQLGPVFTKPHDLDSAIAWVLSLTRK